MSGTFGTQAWEAAICRTEHESLVTRISLFPPFFLFRFSFSFSFSSFLLTFSSFHYLVKFGIYLICRNNSWYILGSSASWAEGPRRRPISPCKPRGPLIPVPFRSVPAIQINERRSTERSGLTARAWKSRLPQLSDETASYRCAYRVRAIVCTWRVRDARARGIPTLRIFFRIAVKREAKIADIYTGKWRYTAE